MKKIKQIISVVLCFLILFTSNAFAADNTGSKTYLQKAYDLGLISYSTYSLGSGYVTRKQTAQILMDFYRNITGHGGITLSKSPFADTDDFDVACVYSFGFMNGVSKDEFLPDAYTKREDFAVAIFKLLEKCGYTYDIVDKNTYKLADEDEISSYALPYVRTLREDGIINFFGSFFNPSGHLTVEQVCNILVNCHEFYGTNYFEINGVKLNIGEKKESVIAKLGEPDRIDKSLFNLERYIYIGNYENYLMLGFENNTLSEIFTTSDNFEYRSISGKLKYSDIDVENFINYTNSKASIRDFVSKCTIYFDKYDNYEIDSIYIISESLMNREKAPFFNQTHITSFEKEIIDLINTKRTKSGIGLVEEASSVSNISNNQCAYLAKLGKIVYVNQANKNLLERLSSSKISFASAAEMSVSLNSDTFEIYNNIISYQAFRVNILDAGYNKVGIGCAINGGHLYYTIDFIETFM